ncbi:MAG TPA: nuclear transport factor 2 family protein [Ktedonobacteraceae bacterium]|nr:nuclear transport factor 2 family protein [Ktedonobacteraceae bacterium]
MSEKLITRLFQIVDSSDWANMPDVFCEDIVYERPGYPPIVGIEQLLHFYKHVRILGSGKHHLEQVVIEGNHGGCFGRFVGQTKDHSEVDELFADMYTFENGKIKHRRSYFFRPAV